MDRVRGEVIARDTIFTTLEWRRARFPSERHCQITLDALKQVLIILPKYRDDPIVTSKESESSKVGWVLEISSDLDPYQSSVLEMTAFCADGISLTSRRISIRVCSDFNITPRVTP